MAGLIPFNSRGIGFNNMLDDFFDDSRFFSRNLSCDTFKIDIRDAEKSFIIDAELSGVPKESVEINVDGDMLTIAVNQEKSNENAEGKYLHRERRVTSSSRSIRLAKADLEGITASMDNGVLSISVPKLEDKPTARNIAIN